MIGQPCGFEVEETHGLLTRKGLRVRACSSGSGWRSLYASVQHEDPFEQHCRAVHDPLVVLHLDGPVGIERRVGARFERTTIGPGGVHMIPDAMAFGVHLCGSLRTLHLYVRRAVIEEVAADCLPGDPALLALLPRMGEQDPVLERLLLAVRDVLDDAQAAAVCYADHLARAVAGRLIQSHSSVAGQRPAPMRREPPSADLHRAIAFMRQNLHRSIDLTEIAGSTPMTASQFARRFRTAVGLPPHRYLLHLRTQHAAYLLRQTRRPIVDVAQDCGFASQEHLTRVFKRAMGTTPASYRATLRG